MELFCKILLIYFISIYLYIPNIKNLELRELVSEKEKKGGKTFKFLNFSKLGQSKFVVVCLAKFRLSDKISAML